MSHKMNIKIACLLITVLFPFLVHANPGKLSLSGAVNMSQTLNNRTKNIHFTFNKDIKGVLKLYKIKFKNKELIKGEFWMDNTSLAKSYIKYSVIFKDKVGPIAQSKGEIHIGKGKNQKVKFGSILLAPEDMRSINAYQIQMMSANK